MSRLHKIFWLILIIIGIGAVAVATRTPARFSRTAASEPPSDTAGTPDPLAEETPASTADDSLEDDTAEDSVAADSAVDDARAGSQNSSQ